MADGVFDHFYNEDKNETYEVVDAQARSDISELDSELDTKVDKVTGKGLSTNDYTDAEQSKLGRIEDGAELNNVFVYKATSVMLDPDNSTIICYILQGSLPRDNNYGLNDRDMVIVDFNGVDATQLPLTSVNMVKFYILGTPTSEVSIYHDVKFRADDGILYSSGMLNYWKPNSIRTFLYKYPVGGTYQGLLLQMPKADLLHYGEVTLSNSLSDAIETTAATSYAVKRLKDMIDAIAGGGFSYEIVQSLPIQGSISTTTMYLVPKQTAGTQNIYDEYINPTGRTADWELIGDTEIDLTNYYTKSETDTLLDDKADTADLATVATTGSYNDLTDNPDLSVYARASDLNNKVDKVTGKGLSTNDYTTAEKNKLSGIEDDAEKNVQSDWNQNQSSYDSYIKNKPIFAAGSNIGIAVSGDGEGSYTWTFSATDTKPSSIHTSQPSGTGSVSLPTSGSWSTVHSFTITGAGLYLINWCVNFNSQSGATYTTSTGTVYSYRGAGISETANSEPKAANRLEATCASGVFTTLSGVALKEVTGASKTFYLNARQNSSVDLDAVHPRIEYIKLR